MSASQIIIGFLFWLGQVKFCITIINRYIVFLRDSLAKHVFTISFATLMTAWPIVAFIFYHDLPLVGDTLRLHPRSIASLLLLLYLLYGDYLLLRANLRALIKTWHNPLPENVRLVKSRRVNPLDQYKEERGDARRRKEPENKKHPVSPFLKYPLNMLNDYYQLESNTYEILYDSLPSNFNGIRIAQISDLHYDRHLDSRFYEFCIREINNKHPDIIFVTGDNISRKHYNPEVMSYLSRLKAPEGVFVLRGNHDFWQDRKGFAKEIRKTRCILLNNRSVVIKRGGQAVRIVGVEHPWKRMKGWDRLLFPRDGLFTICATHTPDNFRRAADAGAALTLCGHTHGGQVRIPFFGPVVCPSKFSRRFDQGFFDKGNSLLYVNRGVGSTIPFRMRCSSEIGFFVLVGEEGA